MQEKINVERVAMFSPELGESMRRLVKLLGTPQELTDKDIETMLAQESYILLVAKINQTIVGMTSLISYRIPYSTKGWIEDVVVDIEYRGKGIGTLLMQKAIDMAKEKKISSLNLTSSKDHASAHGLYEKLGFKKRETNVFRLTLASTT